MDNQAELCLPLRLTTTAVESELRVSPPAPPPSLASRRDFSIRLLNVDTNYVRVTLSKAQCSNLVVVPNLNLERNVHIEHTL